MPAAAARHVLALLAALLTLALGCEPPAPKLAASNDASTQAPRAEPPPPQQGSPHEEEPERGTLKLSSLEILPSTPPGQVPPSWLPDPQQLRATVIGFIAQSPSLSYEPQGRYGVVLQYSAMTFEVPNEPERFVAGASIHLSEAPPEWSSAQIERIVVRDEAPEEAAQQRALGEQIELVLDALERRQAISQLALPDALATLQAPGRAEELGVEAALDLTARLRAHREALKEADRALAISALKSFASRAEGPLVTASFAALLELKAEAIGALMVEASSAASQRGEWPTMMALLAMMAKAHEPVVKAYLQSVSSGHPAEEARAIATESLRQHR